MVWLILLLGAPIQIGLALGAPRLDVLTRFVAAGSLAGIAAAVALLHDAAAPRSVLAPLRDRKLRCALCRAACLLVAGIESVSIVAILAGATGQMWLAEPSIAIANGLSGILPWASAAASALCACTVLLACAADLVAPECGSAISGDEGHRGRAAPLRAVPYAFALIGAMMRIAWTLSADLLVPSDFAALLGLIAVELCAAALLLMDIRLVCVRVIGAAASDVFCIALGAHAAGSLLGSLLLRSVLHLHAVPAGIAMGAAATMFAMLLGLYALMHRAARRPPVETPPDDGVQDEGDARIARIRRMLSERGLALRESEVAAFTAAGQNSEQVGVRLGIKASSVRATLHRVYRKLDVHGAKDLRALCAAFPSAPAAAEGAPARGPAPASPSAQARPAATADGRVASLVLAIRQLSGCVLLLLLFTPLSQRYALWGFGRMTVLGCATGGTLFGLRQLHRRWCVRSGASAPEGGVLHRSLKRMPQPMRSILIGAVVTLACTAAGAASLMRWYSSSLKPSTWSAFEFASYLLCTIALLSWCRCRTDASTQRAASARSAAAAVPLSLLALHLTSDDLVYLGTIALAAILLAATSMAMRAGGAEEGRADVASAAFSFAAAASCLITFAAGVAWEELWRSLAMYSGALSVLPFTALLFGGALWLRMQDADSRDFRELCPTLLAFALFTGVYALLFGYGWLRDVLILLATAGSLCVIIGRARLQSASDPRAPAWMALSAAGGVLGSYLIMNRVSRITPDIFNGAPLAPEQLSAMALVTLAFSVFFLGAGLAALGLCRSIVGSERAAALVASSKLDEAELRHRLRACFVSRGANDTQALVLAEIACGRQAAEICDRLHVSLGTVNTARSAGYRLLGVHDRLGLHSLVSQLITA
ncbi:helix-turn-helix transcriptional regulator [Coriobacterium glomerans]|nr:LuxR C-terminal-related transcriptional regulator [Coriobacterium glomerans]